MRRDQKQIPNSHYFWEAHKVTDTINNKYYTLKKSGKIIDKMSTPMNIVKTLQNVNMEELYDVGEQGLLEVLTDIPFNSWTNHWCAEDLLLMDMWNKLESRMLHEFGYRSSPQTRTTYRCGNKAVNSTRWNTAKYAEGKVGTLNRELNKTQMSVQILYSLITAKSQA